MTIRHWPLHERPREKLLQQGVQSLSDAELLAVVLRTGVRGESAIDLGRGLIADFGSLTALLVAGEDAVTGRLGIGRAKYAQLMAVRELARRVLCEELRRGDVLDHPQAVRDYLRLIIGAREIEVFVVIFLSVRNQVLAIREVSSGTLTETRVYPREVVRQALSHNASAVIVAHNHPSGFAEPSEADIRLTGRLSSALELVDIRMLDHFVVTEGLAVSFAERGLL
ncbi:RadC family protein [Paludibacterium yongneupense]|uniref:RadC family protein n=1 Tax=Paludibacterium yongneupense TaxID=400061 RepID=UPI0004081FDE|nr:DNA repair protein RadC [Paludibacterium yongneupense]